MDGKFELLLIEPIDTFQLIISTWMKHFGCVVDIVHDEGLGLEKAIAKHYDFILIEVGEPDLYFDGFVLATKIREQSTLNKTTTMIALTVQRVPGSEEKAHAAGMDGYFQGTFWESTARAVYDFMKSKIPKQKNGKNGRN